jgi:hypothetical protein
MAFMTRLLDTLRAAWEIADKIAAANPTDSKEGEFQLAAAIPAAIGTSVKRTQMEGKAELPSNKNINRTVMRGIPHFDVYVKEIPIRLNAIELLKFATKRKPAGSANEGNNAIIVLALAPIPQMFGFANRPSRSDPENRYNVNSAGLDILLFDGRRDECSSFIFVETVRLLKSPFCLIGDGRGGAALPLFRKVVVEKVVRMADEMIQADPTRFALFASPHGESTKVFIIVLSVFKQ